VTVKTIAGGRASLAAQRLGRPAGSVRGSWQRQCDTLQSSDPITSSLLCKEEGYACGTKSFLGVES
jgi:hypothetical protein